MQHAVLLLLVFISYSINLCLSTGNNIASKETNTMFYLVCFQHAHYHLGLATTNKKNDEKNRVIRAQNTRNQKNNEHPSADGFYFSAPASYIALGRHKYQFSANVINFAFNQKLNFAAEKIYTFEQIRGLTRHFCSTTEYSFNCVCALF